MKKHIQWASLLCIIVCLPLCFGGCGDNADVTSSAASKSGTTASSKATSAQSKTDSSVEDASSEDISSLEVSSNKVSSAKVSSNKVSSKASSNASSKASSNAASKVSSTLSTILSSMAASSKKTSSAAASSAKASSAAASSKATSSVVIKDLTQGRTLVWSDEFDGTSLDSKKWSTGYAMNTGGSTSTDSNHMTVKNGNLVLTSTGNAYSCVTPPALMTRDKMDFKYGYLEMRAIVPIKHGSWASLWMKSRGGSWMAETDIFEIMKNNNFECNLHKWSNEGGGQHKQLNPEFLSGNRQYKVAKNSSGNLWEEYHVYGFEWTSEYMSFLVDGVEYCHADIRDVSTSKFYGWGTAQGLGGMSGFHNPSYLIINNSVFTGSNFDSSWMSSAMKAVDGDFPFTYSIDYIRLYQKSGETVTVGK